MNRKKEQNFKNKEFQNEVSKCEKCEFTTTSEKGLKTHIKRKHPVPIEETMNFQCEVCDFKASRKIDLKHHAISYSYKFENNTMKCIECDFKGKNAWTLQIHNGKAHSQT